MAEPIKYSQVRNFRVFFQRKNKHPKGFVPLKTPISDPHAIEENGPTVDSMLWNWWYHWFEWYKANRNDGQQENGQNGFKPRLWYESFDFGLTLSESYMFIYMLLVTYLLRLMERTASQHLYKMVGKSLETPLHSRNTIQRATSTNSASRLLRPNSLQVAWIHPPELVPTHNSSRVRYNQLNLNIRSVYM